MSIFTRAELQWISTSAWGGASRFRVRNAGEQITEAEAAYVTMLERIGLAADEMLQDTIEFPEEDG